MLVLASRPLLSFLMAGSSEHSLSRLTECPQRWENMTSGPMSRLVQSLPAHEPSEASVLGSSLREQCVCVGCPARIRGALSARGRARLWVSGRKREDVLHVN